VAMFELFIEGAAIHQAYSTDSIDAASLSKFHSSCKLVFYPPGLCTSKALPCVNIIFLIIKLRMQRG
jgi:hypothetical protein